MTLTERYAANRCAVVDCNRQRHLDAAVCRDDLNELWHHLLVRQADGTYLRRRTFTARETTWRAAA